MREKWMRPDSESRLTLAHNWKTREIDLNGFPIGSGAGFIYDLNQMFNLNG